MSPTCDSEAGERGFEALAGHFWDDLSTRPYMRARAALAETLVNLERFDEAIAHYEGLLGLNPNDNQGNRYPLLAVLLERDRNDDAIALIGRYADEAGTEWAYGRALLAFRAEGDTPASRPLLRAAIAANPHVARFLTTPEDMPTSDPPYVTVGGRDEAIGVADDLAAAFELTPGAMAWLARETARGPRSRRGRTPKRRPGV